MTDSEQKRILLAEDHPPNVLVATTLLEEFGYHYEVAGNGEEALRKIKDQPFDLVLMDVQMPGIDGYEATHFIREWEKELGHKRIPIIGMTAHALIGDRSRCFDAGMDDYLAKPFHPDDLEDKLKKHLSRTEQAKNSTAGQ